MVSPIEHRLTLTSRELATVIQGLRLLNQQILNHPEESRTVSELARRLEAIYRARTLAPGGQNDLRR